MLHKKTSRNEQRYTVDELDTLWVNYDTQPDMAFELLKTHYDQVALLWEDDPAQGAERVKTALFAWLNAVIEPSVRTQAVVDKEPFLFDLLRLHGVARTILQDRDGRYAVTAFVLCQALTENEHNDLSLEVLWHSVFRDEPENHIMDTGSCARFSQQAARPLMPQAWCLLVEPSLQSWADVVQTVWIERPPLLTDVRNSNHQEVAPAIQQPTDVFDLSA